MLKCFTEVATSGGLSEAANRLGRTPSAVSMMLKQFEERVGSPLFETNRKSRLTPLGALILTESKRQIRAFEATVATIEGLAQSEYGQLRIAVTPSVATSILPGIVATFVTDHPNVQIDIRDMDSGSIASELQMDQTDIGIGTLPEMDGMIRTEIFNDPFGVVCRKDHPLALDWDDLTWRDMVGQDFIANGLSHMIDDPDFTPLLEASRLFVRSTASLFALVSEGVGVTVLPKLAMANQPANLVFLPLKDAKARRSVHMVSRPNDALLPAARDFCSVVSSQSAKIQQF